MQSGSLVIHPFSLPLAPMNGLYPSHHCLKTCTTSMVKMLQTCPFWKPFLLPTSSSRSQGDTLPGEIATGEIPTSLQMPHIPIQATRRPTSPRLGGAATPSMVSQPQHLDQTKGIRSRQIPCWHQACVSSQSHVLPASHNEPSISFSFWIETSWRREHSTHHKVLRTSRCAPDTWWTGDTMTVQFEHEGHKEFFINTIVAYDMSLHDILYLWRICVVNGEVGDSSSISMENLYPLLPLQRAILNDITTALTSRQQTQEQSSEEDTLETSNWHNLVPANLKCWFVPFTLQSKRKCLF